MDVYQRAALSGPWQAFAITEHAFALALPEDDKPWPFQWYHHPERVWSRQTFREEKTAQLLARMAATCDGMRIFSGLEVEVACDGSLSMDECLWPYLDVVIGSMHYLPGPRTQWVHEHFTQLEMLLRYPIDILGHPFREISRVDPLPDEVIDETLLRAQHAGVAIEINAHMPFARDHEVLARAVRLGLPIAFSLDAHHHAELALHSYFAEVVAASGVNPETIHHFSPTRSRVRIEPSRSQT